MSPKYIKDVKSEPLYDVKTGKLLGWKLIWNYAEPEFGCLEILTPASRFFGNRWFQNGYKAMCRFKNDLLAKYNENTK